MNKYDQDYQYGFNTDLDTTRLPLGLSKQIIYSISKENKEDDYFLQWRLNAYDILLDSSIPNWSELDLADFSLDKFSFFSSLDTTSLHNQEQINKLIDQLKLPQDGTNDFILDSTTIQPEQNQYLQKHGIIFTSLRQAIKKHHELVKQYLGSVVPASDNYFATLNSALFSAGTFIYIPSHTICKIPLSTYFRINEQRLGQFERTLIILEPYSQLHYFEGCTARSDQHKQLHAAVVEIIAGEGAQIHYTTVQNWYNGHRVTGKGGVYNLVTKRGLAHTKSHIIWSQIELGAAITWKYPSVILHGDHSKGEFHSLAYTDGLQQAETGSKMIHLGQYTKSVINSKTISSGKSLSVYRGKVHIMQQAQHAMNWSNCDSLLLQQGISMTIPTIQVDNANSTCEHEAQTWSLSMAQIFYLQTRGISDRQACQAAIIGFSKPIIQQLPLEFAVEVEEIIKDKLNDATNQRNFIG